MQVGLCNQLLASWRGCHAPDLVLHAKLQCDRGASNSMPGMIATLCCDAQGAMQSSQCIASRPPCRLGMTHIKQFRTNLPALLAAGWQYGGVQKWQGARLSQIPLVRWGKVRGRDGNRHSMLVLVLLVLGSMVPRLALLLRAGSQGVPGLLLLLLLQPPMLLLGKEELLLGGVLLAQGLHPPGCSCQAVPNSRQQPPHVAPLSYVGRPRLACCQSDRVDANATEASYAMH